MFAVQQGIRLFDHSVTFPYKIMSKCHEQSTDVGQCRSRSSWMWPVVYVAEQYPRQLPTARNICSSRQTEKRYNTERRTVSVELSKKLCNERQMWKMRIHGTVFRVSFLKLEQSRQSAWPKHAWQQANSTGNLGNIVRLTECCDSPITL